MENQAASALDIDNVRTAVSQLLPSGQPKLENTAEMLGLSSRTLQRRLAVYDITYTQLVDEVRFFSARNLIIYQHKMTDIATKLGYADAGSFTRAFVRWTGMSPYNYRKRFCRGLSRAKK